jgi:hypothetical protein
LQFLINDLYARHGQIFKNPALQAFFDQKSWYKAHPSPQSISLSKLEEDNVQFLNEKRSTLLAERTALIDQLKAFKKLVLADKLAELKSQFNFEYEKGFEEPHSTYLKNIFRKVDLDNLHFFKHQGLASVTVDNVIYVSEYAVQIEKHLVQLVFNLSGQSKIIDESDFPKPF